MNTLIQMNSTLRVLRTLAIEFPSFYEKDTIHKTIHLLEKDILRKRSQAFEKASAESIVKKINSIVKIAKTNEININSVKTAINNAVEEVEKFIDSTEGKEKIEESLISATASSTGVTNNFSLSMSSN